MVLLRDSSKGTSVDVRHAFKSDDLLSLSLYHCTKMQGFAWSIRSNKMKAFSRLRKNVSPGESLLVASLSLLTQVRPGGRHDTYNLTCVGACHHNLL